MPPSKWSATSEQPTQPSFQSGAEHEVVDEELGATVEELGERLAPLVGLEDVRLLDPHPRQLPAEAGELIAALGVLLLEVEQLTACSIHSSRVPVECSVMAIPSGPDARLAWSTVQFHFFDRGRDQSAARAAPSGAQGWVEDARRTDRGSAPASDPRGRAPGRCAGALDARSGTPARGLTPGRRDAYAQLAAEGYLALRQGARPRSPTAPRRAPLDTGVGGAAGASPRFDFRPERARCLQLSRARPGCARCARRSA